MKLGFTAINTITPSMSRLDNALPGMRDQALADAGMVLWERVVNSEPKPPIDTGNLRGSGALFVNSRLITMKPPVESKGNPTTTQTTPQGEAWFGLDTPYTAYQHELAQYITHRRPGANADAGPKFISLKIQRYKNDFAKVYGITMTNSLDNQGKPKSSHKG